MSNESSITSVDGLNTNARSTNERALDRSAGPENINNEQQNDLFQTVLDHGLGLTDDTLWRLREAYKLQMYREDHSHWRNANAKTIITNKMREDHERDLRSKLWFDKNYHASTSQFRKDKAILADWASKRAYVHGKNVYRARKEMIRQLKLKYAGHDTFAQLAEYISYLLCFRMGLPIMLTQEMPQDSFFPDEHFPADQTPEYKDQFSGTKHRFYLFDELFILSEFGEGPDPQDTDGVALKWNHWSEARTHNGSAFTMRFDVFSAIQAKKQDQGEPSFSIKGIQAEIYRRHPICLFIDKYFPKPSDIVDLIAIIQSSPFVRYNYLKRKFVDKVIAGLQQGLEVMEPFMTSQDFALRSRQSIRKTRRQLRRRAHRGTSDFYNLFAPVPIKSFGELRSKFNKLLKKPIAIYNYDNPERNVDWGEFRPLLFAACAELFSDNEAVSSHLVSQKQDPLLLLLSKEIFPGLDKWSVSDAIGYVLLVLGIVLTIAAIASMGTLVGGVIAVVALAFDGLSLGLSANDVFLAIEDAQKMEFENMFSRLNPALVAYQSQSSVQWAVGMLIFDILLLGLPSVVPMLKQASPTRVAMGKSDISGSTLSPNARGQGQTDLTPAERTGTQSASDDLNVESTSTKQSELRNDEIPPVETDQRATQGDENAELLSEEKVTTNTNALDGNRASASVPDEVDMDGVLSRQADEILFGGTETTEAQQRARRLTREYKKRLTESSPDELQRLARDPETPPEIRNIILDQENPLNRFFMSPNDNLLYSVKGSSGTRGLVFKELRNTGSKRTATGIKAANPRLKRLHTPS